MSWYRDYKEQWKEIIETVAAEEHRTTQMVEKNTIQSMILFGRYVQFYQSYPEIVGIMTSQSDDLENSGIVGTTTPQSGEHAMIVKGRSEDRQSKEVCT